MLTEALFTHQAQLTQDAPTFREAMIQINDPTNLNRLLGRLGHPWRGGRRAAGNALDRRSFC